MKLQTSIAGYHGQPITLLSLLDDQTGVLVILKQAKYREERLEGFSFITNLSLPDRDFQFTDEHLRDAIRGYFIRQAQKTLDLDDAVQRYRPENKIESDEVDEKGRKYRIAGDIDNGQIAVLATLAFVERQAGISIALTAAADMARFSIETI